jgi:chemosensory pili system protein ChpE
MLNIILISVASGMMFSLYPGAQIIQTLRLGLQQGFISALCLQIGWLLGLVIWAVINPAGTDWVFEQPDVKLLSLSWILCLAWLGVGSLRDAWLPPVTHNQVGRNARSGLIVGVVLSLSHPMHIVEWGAIVSLIPKDANYTTSLSDKMIFFGVGVLSSVICCFAIAGFVHLIRKKISIRWERISYGVCGVILISLAGMTLMDVVSVM